jgi:hypothetical protein
MKTKAELEIDVVIAETALKAAWDYRDECRKYGVPYDYPLAGGDKKYSSHQEAIDAAMRTLAKARAAAKGDK